MGEYIIKAADWAIDYNGDSLFKDAEEIVRCKDCYFADEIEGGYWCDRFDCGKEHVTSNGFCAWGERKEGGDGIPD